MRINIFGVGRSGTKALQVYISYILAQKYDKVWINYEPYFWLNRKINHRSYKGIYFDTKENFFPNSLNELSKKHQDYISGLGIGHKFIVNKFIRGHGRINEINDLINPDYTIVIVRNVLDVLSSLQKTGFNLYQIGKYSQIDYYNKIIKNFRKSILYEKNRHDNIIDRADNELRKNALIWYLYNLSLLNFDKSIIIKFSDIGSISDFAKQNLGSQIEFSNDSRFNGHNIHTDLVFKDDSINKAHESILSKVLLYTIYRLKPRWLKERMVGSLVSLSDKDISLEKNTFQKRDEYSEINDSFIKDLNEEIMVKLKSI